MISDGVSSGSTPHSKQDGHQALPIYQDSSASISARVEDLLSRMTLAEKIGQMTLVEKNSLTPEAVASHFIGAVLSGGGGYPPENSPEGWFGMVRDFQEASLDTRLRIPLLYGIDAVHGHGNLHGAVIFPHNIGLGATRDADLVFRIGRATAEELAATGIRWNYAPTVAVPQDIRWGRTYEGFSEETSLVTTLGTAYLRGLQGDFGTPLSVLGTPKHFAGDGATIWGTSTTVFPPTPAHGIEEPRAFVIDQGDTRLDEGMLRAIHLKPYIAAIQAGAQAIMASFSSWNGLKLHAHRYMLTEVLKDELGFSGFVVSDWGGIDQVSSDYYQAVVTSINAGIDMNMVPQDYVRFIRALTQAVERGDVPQARIDDAVRRILGVKFKLNLFEHPVADPKLLSLVGAPEHRALAREAVGKSLVLLKNENNALPLSKSLPLIFVAGRWADDIGLQCGGWTIEWLGKSGEITPGTTILEAVQASVSPETEVVFDPAGDFTRVVDEKGNPRIAEVGLVVVGESPYAEGFGDQADLSLTNSQIELITRMRQQTKKLIVILISGRPRLLTEQLPQMDALVAAWLPGTEGSGVTDALFGDIPFTGKLSYTWPRSADQIPFNTAGARVAGTEPLFPYGFGLS